MIPEDVFGIITPEDALEIMCKLCKRHVMCQGTGCAPKNILKKLLEKQKEGGQE